MLVLTRKYGESIDIEGPCKVTVLKVMGNSIRIGVEAEKETKILRSEIIERQKRAEENANH